MFAEYIGWSIADANTMQVKPASVYESRKLGFEDTSRDIDCKLRLRMARHLALVNDQIALLPNVSEFLPQSLARSNTLVATEVDPTVRSQEIDEDLREALVLVGESHPCDERRGALGIHHPVHYGLQQHRLQAKLCGDRADYERGAVMMGHECFASARARAAGSATRGSAWKKELRRAAVKSLTTSSYSSL